MFILKRTTVVMLALACFFWIHSFQPAAAMHIMEGFLPLKWAILWWALTIPFIAAGIRSIQKTIKQHPETKMMLGLARPLKKSI